MSSDIIDDIGVDETPKNVDDEKIKGLVEKLCMKNGEWVKKVAILNF